MVGIDADRRLRGSNRVAELADLEQRMREPGEGDGVGWIVGHGLAQQRDAIVDIAAGDEQRSEIGHDPVVIRFQPQRLAQHLDGWPDVAACL